MSEINRWKVQLFQKPNMKNIPSFECTLLHKDRDGLYVLYMDGDELVHHVPTYKFQAASRTHARELLGNTDYEDLKRVKTDELD